jgi:hypothetical protein
MHTSFGHGRILAFCHYHFIAARLVAFMAMPNRGGWLRLPTIVSVSVSARVSEQTLAFVQREVPAA